MKKNFFATFLALVMVFAASSAIAGENFLQNLTGHVWEQSSLENKTAFIHGIESAIAIEYSVAAVKAKNTGKPTDKESIVKSLTIFPKNWILAFDGEDKRNIVAAIDAWYAKNTDQLQKPVLNVLWYEIMEPKLTTK